MRRGDIGCVALNNPDNVKPMGPALQRHSKLLPHLLLRLQKEAEG